MYQFLLYMHGGSANKGCEAIVRSTCKIIDSSNNTLLLSLNAEEDIKSRINLVCDIKSSKEFHEYSVGHLLAFLMKKLLGTKYFYYKTLISSSNSHTLALSIGGDNYCYEGIPATLRDINVMLKQRGARTILWGCSIEPDIIKADIIDDLKRYDLITARESITYNALLNKGINKNTLLFPDPAFVLEQTELPLPEGFVEGNTVGVNISPLIMSMEIENSITYKNYVFLMEHIINTTQMQIALIPHVYWEHNNDLEPLTALFEQFQDTDRVVLIGDQYDCMELKGFISRCRFFIGARTHATIAAYSTCVPTLVVGYSVKARGIARDIFGSEENMVIPVQSLEYEDDLVNAFKYIQENENGIRKHLQDFMPTYIEKAWKAGNEVTNLLEK